LFPSPVALKRKKKFVAGLHLRRSVDFIKVPGIRRVASTGDIAKNQKVGTVDQTALENKSRLSDGENGKH